MDEFSAKRKIKRGDSVRIVTPPCYPGVWKVRGVVIQGFSKEDMVICTQMDEFGGETPHVPVGVPVSYVALVEKQ